MVVLGVLAAGALVLSVVALVLAGSVWRERRASRATGLAGVPDDVLGLRQEVAALQLETRGALRHLAIVRYDAFGGSDGGGGRLSWSLALADDTGGGMVLTSISGRNEVRSYAKALADWASEQPLSPEEAEAVTAARPG